MVRCEWCGEPMQPPFPHLDYCQRMNVLEVAARIDKGGEFHDVEARRVAAELIRLREDMTP